MKLYQDADQYYFSWKPAEDLKVSHDYFSKKKLSQRLVVLEKRANYSYSSERFPRGNFKKITLLNCTSYLFTVETMFDMDLSSESSIEYTNENSKGGTSMNGIQT